MSQTTVILLTLVLMVAAFVAYRRHPAAAAPGSHPAKAKARVGKTAARTRAQPIQRTASPPAHSAVKSGAATRGVTIDTRAPATAPAAATALEWVGAATPSPTPAGENEQLRTKLRDRYIAARFPGMFRGTAGMRDTDQVIKVARLYFEEQKIERAQELLDLAISLSPSAKLLRLAQLEISFLGRDGAVFTKLARAFRTTHPDSPEWADVSRLGHAIAPGEELFGANPGERSHEHYGPWPDMPNWIQASWDLTSEVLAADFHRAIATRQEA